MILVAERSLDISLTCCRFGTEQLFVTLLKALAHLLLLCRRLNVEVRAVKTKSGNLLLAGLSNRERRILDHRSTCVDLERGTWLAESGTLMRHVYFPISASSSPWAPRRTVK